jgi:CubicO group peptidase (beta-lactamase class C family)
MSKNRNLTWPLLFVLGVGLIIAFIGGLWTYMVATATPIHPTPEDVPTATRPTPSPEWVTAVDRARQATRAGLVEQNLPGLSVAVGIKGQLVWAEGLGWADLENRVPATPETRFRIGTASIALTSAAVGLLLDQGRMNLDAEIQTYVPAFPKKQWPVTLRQAMGHTAGIRGGGGDEEPVNVRCERTADGLQRFAERDLPTEPGTVYRFSLYSWMLVSAAVEGAAQQPFYTFMRKQIFEPLGMAHTQADAPGEPVVDRSEYYFPRFAADPRYGPQEREQVDYSCFLGASAFLSTAADLVRFGLAINGGTFLKPETVRLLQSSQRLPNGQDAGYGLGWDLETVTLSGEPAPMVGHDGDMRGGPVSSFMTFGKDGLVVAVIANTSYADTTSIALKIAEAFSRR